MTLAQRMVDKHISENKLNAEQEVQLYLSILNYQDKHQEALNFIESDLGKELYPGVPVTLKIDLLKRLNKWTELHELIESLLKEK